MWMWQTRDCHRPQYDINVQVRPEWVQPGCVRVVPEFIIEGWCML